MNKNTKFSFVGGMHRAMRWVQRLVPAVVTVGIFVVAPAHAADKYWRGLSNGGTQGWNNASYWSPSGVPAAGDALILDDPSATPSKLLLDQARTISTLTCAAGRNLDNNGFKITLNGGTSSTCAGVISGAGGVDKYGGNYVLTLTGANTFTGPLGVLVGTVAVGHATALGSTAGRTTVSSGGTLEISAGIAVGAEPVTLNGPGYSSTGALRSSSGSGLTSLSGPVTLNTGSTIGVDGTSGVDVMTLSGVIDGAGALTKSGTGSLILNGGNTYTGTTTVGAGTLQLDNTAISYTSATTVNSGATLILRNLVTGIGSSSRRAVPVNYGGAGTVSVQNADFIGSPQDVKGGWVVLQGAVSLTGQINVVSGVFGSDGTADWSANTADVTVSSGAIFTHRRNNVSIGGLNGSGYVAATWQNQTTEVLSIGAGNKSGSFSGVIRGDAVSTVDYDMRVGTTNIAKIGTGTQTLSGSSTYAGTTAVTGGKLIAGHAAALGSSAKGTTVSSGAALGLQGNINIASEPLSLTGTGMSSSGALYNVSGTNTYGGPITLAAAASINNDVASTTLTLGGVSLAGFELTLDGTSSVTGGGIISGTGAGSNLVKKGTGTATLTGANTYAGTTTVSAGTLEVGSGGTSGSIDSNSGTTVSTGATLKFNRSNAYSSTKIIAGQGSVIQAGTGTTTLSATNTYTGTTTVSAGTLSVTGVIASGATTVSSGATLKGTGTLNNTVTISSGGKLSPGLSPGTITMSGLVLSSGSILDMELGQAGTVAGTYNDLVQVNGDLSLSGGTLNLSQSTGGTLGVGRYRLIDYTGTCTGCAAGGLVIGTVPSGMTANQFAIEYLPASKQVNLIVGATVKVQKTTVGGFGGPFSFTQNNLASAPADIPTTADNTPTPASPVAINVTTLGTDVTITETSIANYGLTSATCTDANSAVTGNNVPGFATLAGNVLTIPGANVKAGADFTCVFTNTYSATTYWDGTDTTGNGAVDGDTAIWNATGINWTTSAGMPNGIWAGGTNVAHFGQAASATVTVVGTQQFGGLNVATFSNYGFSGSGEMKGTGSPTTIDGQVTSSVVLSGGDFKVNTYGYLYLTGANTFTGTMDIAANATVAAMSAGALGTAGAGTTVAGGGTLAVGDVAIGAEPLTISGTGNASTLGAFQAITSTAGSFGGPVTLAAAATIRSTGSGTFTFGGTMDLASYALTLRAEAALVANGIISGTGSLVKTGGAIATLGAANTYTGTTTVSAGTLSVTGSTSTGATTVQTGATLKGTGSLNNTVTINSGGKLSPGLSPGTITMSGLVLSSGSILDMELGQAGTVAGTYNDLVQVNGALSLAGGTLNITQSAGGSFTAGTYRLINYTGGLSNTGGLVIGTVPAGFNMTVDTSIGGQVNLIVTAITGTHWDGTQTAAGGSTSGGDGGDSNWDATRTNWTTSTGTPNGIWAGGTNVAIFEGAAGTATVTSPQSIGGLTFKTTGYTVSGGTLTGAATNNVLTADASVSATVSSVLAGSNAFDKQGAGTLSITVKPTYTGSTTVSAGTLVAGTAGASYTEILTNTSSVSIKSGATLRLDASDVFTTAKPVPVTVSGTLATNNSTNYVGDLTLAGGTVVLNGGAGCCSPLYVYDTVTSTGTSSVTLGPNAGTLVIGNSTAGTVTTFNVTGSLDIAAGLSAMVWGGNNGITKTGQGTLTLTGASSYTAITTISAGTLQVGANGALSSASATTVNVGATLNINSKTQTLSNGLTSNGTLALGNGGVLTLSASSSTIAGANVTGTGKIVVGTGATLTLTSALVNTDVEIELAGGTLNLGAFTHSIGTLTVSANSTLDFDSGTAKLSATNLAMSAGGTQTLNITNWTKGTDVFQATQVNGSVASPTRATTGQAPLNRITLTGSTAASTVWTATSASPANEITTQSVATVKVQKTTVGGFGGPFSFTQNNLASAPADIPTTADNTPTPASPVAINVTTLGTDVTITETSIANYGLTSATCTDGNSTVTGNNAPGFATLAGNVLTIPGANVKAGADFTCVFTNTYVQATHWDGTNITAGGSTTGGDGGTSDWNATLTNWTTSSGTPNGIWAGGTNVAIFEGTAGTANVIGTQSIGGLTFSHTVSTYTVSGGTLTGAASNNVIQIDNSNAATVSSVLDGVAGNTFEFKTNGTAVQLTLDGANTFLGLAKITSGVVGVSNASALGGSAVGTEVTNATLFVENSVNIAAEPLKLSNGTLTVCRGSVYGGPITLAGSGTMTTVGPCPGASGPASKVTGTVNLGSYTLTAAPASIGPQLTLDGVISGTGGVTVDSFANEVIFGAANLYSGPTSVSIGEPILQLAVNNGIPSGSATTVVADGKLDLNSKSQTLSNGLASAGTLALGTGGVLTLSGSSSTIAGAKVTGSGKIIVQTGATLTLTSALVNTDVEIELAGGTLNLGAFAHSIGTLTVSANSTLDFDSGTAKLSATNLAMSAGGTQTLNITNWTKGTDVLQATQVNGSVASPTRATTGQAPLNRITLTGSTAASTVWTATSASPANEITTQSVATVKVQKTTVGGFGGPFSFTQNNLASAPADIPTTADNTPTPASPVAINVTTLGTDVTITETSIANYGLTSATCTDANSAVTGNNAPGFATLAGNVLTIPGANVKAGADFTCVFTNTYVQTTYWDGTDTAGNGVINGGTSNWDATTTNWTTSSGTPNGIWAGGSNVAIFQGAAGAVTVNGTQDMGGMTFNVDSYTLTGDPLNLTGASNTITVGNASDTAIIGNALLGNPMVKSGAGQLTLTFDGRVSSAITSVDVQQGTLQLGNGVRGGLATSSNQRYVSVQSGATLTYYNNLNFPIFENVSGAGNLVFKGTGVPGQSGYYFIYGTGLTTGSVTVESGADYYQGAYQGRIGSGAVTVKAGGAFEQYDFTINNAFTIAGTGWTARRGGRIGALTVGDGEVAGTVTLAGDSLLCGGGSGGTISGVISGAFAIDKGCDSAILTLSGANTYGGSTTVSLGTLRIGANGTLPTASAVTVAAGATLDVNSKTQTLSNGLTSNGTLALGAGGVLTLSGGSSTIAGANVTGTGKIVVGTGATLTLTSALVNSGVEIELAGGTLNLGVFTHSIGTLTVSGNSTLDFASAGNAQITAGTLAMNASRTLNVTNWTRGADKFYASAFTGASANVIGVAPMNQITLNGPVSYAPALTVWQSDNEINVLLNPRLRLAKTSNGGVGTFGFAMSGLSASNDSITTATSGVRVLGTSGVTGTTGQAVTITESIVPTGWPSTPVSASCVDANGANNANGPGAFGALSGNVLSVAGAKMVAGADITCTFDNGLNSLSGKVFNDGGAPSAGVNTGTPNDGIVNGSESGVGGGVGVSLTDCAATTYASTTADAAGSYSLSIPAAATGQPVCLQASVPSGYRATGASVSGTATPDGASTTVGGTAYSYSRSANRQSFTAAAGGAVVVNFGLVPESTLVGNSNKQGAAGGVVTHGHSFTAGTGGSLSVSTGTATATPTLAGWSEVIYADPNCTGALPTSGTPVKLSPPATSQTVVQGQQVCFVVQEFVPAGAANTNANSVPVNATLVLTNANPGLSASYTVTDVTTVGSSALTLQKEVRNVTTNGDWGTNNLAKSGQTLEYRVTYSNTSAAPLTSVMIADGTNTYTTFVSATASTPPTTLGTCTMHTPVNPAPAAGVACSPAQTGTGKGAITWTFSGSLQPGGTGTVSYSVTVD